MNIKSTLFAIISLLVAGAVYSQSDATGIVKERTDSMKDMGEKSKIVGNMFKGKADFDHAALIDTATVFVLHGSRLTELFPDTTDSRTGSETRALPKIWDEWDAFNTMITKFVSSSEALQSTVAATEDIGQLKKAFFQTTKNCSGCHKRFRKPKD